MGQALPGENYCEDHQGNHSHYAPHNCTVCGLTTLLSEAYAELRKQRPVLKAIFDQNVWDCVDQWYAAVEAAREETK